MNEPTLTAERTVASPEHGSTVGDGDTTVGGVERRGLVPSAREQELGVRVADYDFVEPALEQRARFSMRRALIEWASMTDPRRIEGSKLPLVVLGIGGFVGAAYAAALPILLPELEASFGLDLQFILGLFTALSAVYLVFSIPLGYLADRVNRVRAMQIGALVGSASKFAQAGAPTANALVPGIAGSGVSPAIGMAMGFPLIADYYPVRARGRVFGAFFAIQAIGGVIGPSVTGRIGAALGWRSVFFIFAVLEGAAGLLMFFLREPKRGYVDRLDAGATEEQAVEEQKVASFSESFRATWSIVTMRRLWYGGVFGYVGGLGFALLLQFYLASVFQVGLVERGDIGSLSSVMAFIGVIFSGAFADKVLSKRPTRFVTYYAALTFIQAGQLVVMAVSPWLWLSVGLSLPMGLVAALFVPAETVLSTMVVPARVRGMALQMVTPFRLVGILLMNGVIGLVGNDLRHGFLIFFPFTVVGGLFILSAAGGVTRDIRAAEAANLAQLESEKARSSGRNKMVVCRDVDVEYDGVQVLFNVDFDVEEGEIIALLGTNGAGKSTLLRAIAGIQQASNGAIFLDGKDITHSPPHENAGRGVVMMPGGNAVFPTLSVEENLRTAAWMYRAEDEYVAERMAEVFDFFPVLQERRDQPAGNLSGGEQQMVGLAQALLMRPRLLMIDELSLGLAPKVVEQLLDTLRAIHAQGTTVVIVEQSLNVALTIAERAVFMEKGEIEFSGPTAELLQRPDLIRAVFMGGGGGGRLVGPRLRGGRAGDRSTALLSVSDVSVSFGGIHALRSVDLEVDDGEILGIIGPNGAGKTTLFDVISGFLAPDRGSVVLDDEDVTRLPADVRARLGLARSFQNARLFPSLTVRENLTVALDRKAVKSAVLGALWTAKTRRAERRIASRVDDLIDLLGLSAYANKFVRELSTGTRRAVDMACIMAADPKLLLLDEPSSGLAQAETEELGPVLLQVAHDTGCAMLVIEHDLPLITSLSDRLAAMELGSVVVTGTPQDVVNDQRVLASYLSATEEVLARSDTAMATIASAVGVPNGSTATRKRQTRSRNPSTIPES